MSNLDFDTFLNDPCIAIFTDGLTSVQLIKLKSIVEGLMSTVASRLHINQTDVRIIDANPPEFCRARNEVGHTLARMTTGDDMCCVYCGAIFQTTTKVYTREDANSLALDYSSVEDELNELAEEADDGEGGVPF
jgi:hypothetical protein